MDNPNAVTSSPSCSSWVDATCATAVSSSGSGTAANRQQNSSSSSTASYEILPRRIGNSSSSESSTTATTNTSVSWATTTADNLHYDNNNNSSSCPNHEQRVAEAKTKSSSADIAELAKSIGNEFRGEFIVLPHHLVNFDHGDPVNLAAGGGDDELSSNSEDCVYAYRGDHELHPIAVDADDDYDDETDFLEMDFDPNSEQEQMVGSNGASGTNEEEYPRADPSDLLERTNAALNEWRGRNEPVAGCSSGTEAIKDVSVAVDQPLGEELEAHDSNENKCGENVCNDGDYYDRLNGSRSSSSKNSELEGDDDEDSLDIAAESDEEELPMRPIVTGTKPKVKMQRGEAVIPPQISNNNISHVPDPSSNSPIDPNPEKEVCGDGGGGGGKVSCMECSEMELLTMTSSGSSSSGDGGGGLAQERSRTSSHCKRHCKKLRNHEPEVVEPPTEIPGNTKQIQICPNILDEENIFSSFLLLGIELQRDRLHEQIEENRLALERTKTIAGYLIKFTKANCDPRRFVKLIESCCPAELLSDLEFNFQSVGTEFNVLHVASGEILSRWSAEEGLRELGRLTNRRFYNANVLGRVANVLRLRLGDRQKGREGDRVPVPTYYRPGILLISRRDNQTNATLL